METVTTAILDKFPNLRHCKIWVVLSVSIFGYLGGLGFTTNVSEPLVSNRFLRLNSVKFKSILNWIFCYFC